MKPALISKPFYTVFVTTMLLFTAGVCAGSAAASLLPRSVSESAANSIFGNINPDRLAAFSASLINFLKPVAFIWVSGFFKYTFPAICVVTVYRGGIIGYFIGALVKSKGAVSALLHSAASLLPHYLLFIPMIAASAYFALKHRTPTSKKRQNPPYFVYLALLAAGCAIAALCDAYVSVFFIKLLQK